MEVATTTSISTGPSVLPETSQICAAFNKHFAVAGYLFDNVVSDTDNQSMSGMSSAALGRSANSSFSLTTLDSVQLHDAQTYRAQGTGHRGQGTGDRGQGTGDRF